LSRETAERLTDVLADVESAILQRKAAARVRRD